MKESYGEIPAFRTKTLKLIHLCDSIISEYSQQGYKLTIRQLYYQLVARDYIPNTVQSYDNVVGTMTKARLAGLIDWDAIEDRTREVIERSHWSSGSELLHACANQYHEDMWDEQDARVFVVVEKEALAGVLERVCQQYDVPLLAARGYPSATTLRELAKTRIMHSPQQIVVLHLGDHDPSGMDMSRDLEERLQLFSRGWVDIEFRRLALNMDQVEELRPPPNPAKQTDARFYEYSQRFGDESWELDALTPKYLTTLVSEAVEEYQDPDVWQKTKDRIQDVRRRLTKLANEFDTE